MCVHQPAACESFIIRAWSADGWKISLTTMDGCWHVVNDNGKCKSFIKSRESEIISSARRRLQFANVNEPNWISRLSRRTRQESTGNILAYASNFHDLFIQF
jgi:hypothetical protein